MASITQKAVRRMRRTYGLKVYTRNQWTNNPTILAKYAWRRVNRHHSLLPKKPVDTLWAHISVTFLEDNGKPKSMKQIANELHEIGMQRFGTGISYNFLLHPLTGEIALGQALDAAGAHTLNDKGIPGYSFNQNYVSLAVCTVGMPGIKLSHSAELSFAKLIAALQDVGALTEGFDFNPHSMVAPKDCPTDGVRDRMPLIYNMAISARKLHK